MKKKPQLFTRLNDIFEYIKVDLIVEKQTNECLKQLSITCVNCYIVRIHKHLPDIDCLHSVVSIAKLVVYQYLLCVVIRKKICLTVWYFSSGMGLQIR